MSLTVEVGLTRGEYVDSGLSGRTARRRPALEDALAILRVREADALVVAKLDRLARSTIALARIMSTAQMEEWTLVVLSPDIDSSTPAGQLTATVLGAVAEYESELIAERAPMTHRQRLADGKRPGPSPMLPGEIRAEVAARRATGEPLASIANDLNDLGVQTARGGRWHPSTVRHVARSVSLDKDSPSSPAVTRVPDP